MNRSFVHILLILFQIAQGWTLSNCMAEENVSGSAGEPSALFEDNEIYRNNIAGIRIRGDIPVSIEGCRIFSNGQAGITTHRQASLTTRRCDIYQNESAGIDIEGARHAAISDSRIYRNRLAGIRMEIDKARGEIELSASVTNSEIYMNGTAGVDSVSRRGSTVDLALTENAIYKNAMAGVSTMAVSSLSAKGNRISNNGAAGILSGDTAVPPRLDIYQNTISFNRGSGIYIQNGCSDGIGIRNNWVFNNLYSGIVLGLAEGKANSLTDIGIINNTVVANGSNDQGAGIWNEGKGKVRIINNIVAYNYTTGIKLKRCKGYAYNLVFANGDLPSRREDAGPFPSWVENRELGGCPDSGEGDLGVDPLFSDPDNYDFSLQDGSPAIDGGSDRTIYNDVSRGPSKGTDRNDVGATGGPYAIAQ